MTWCRVILAGLGFLALSAAPPPSPAAFRDLALEYTLFYHETDYPGAKPMPVDERVMRFRALMDHEFPGFYTETRVGAPKAEYNAIIAKSFADYPAIEPRFLAVSAQLRPQLAGATRQFHRAFPDAGALPPTYLLHSLGEMDGGTREVGGRTVLVFGADVIAKVHRPGANERPFFEHEIFHTYHEPRFGKCDGLWCSAWEEGLAVYVSQRLNPGARNDELLFTDDLRKTLDAERTAAVCALRERALSTSDGDYSALFMGGHSLAGLPPRAGYYVGYLIAKRLGDGQPLTTPAHWTAAEARPRVLAALAALAPDCPPKPPAPPSSS